MDVTYTRPVMGPLLRGHTLSLKGAVGSEVQLSLLPTHTMPTPQSTLCAYSHFNAFALLLPLAHKLSSDTRITSSPSSVGLCQDDASIRL